MVEQEKYMFLLERKKLFCAILKNKASYSAASFVH